MAEIKALVPVMTSNTTPEGECGASSVHSGFPAYYAFNGTTYDRSISGRYWASNGHLSDQYVYYKFTKKYIVTNFKFKSSLPSGSADSETSCVLIASNDGSNWIDIQTYTIIAKAGNSGVLYELDVNKSNQGYYLYYGVKFPGWPIGDAESGELQFYGTDDPSLIKSAGSIEAIRDWFNASLYNKEEIDNFFIQNNQQGLIPYDLTILSEIPGQFIKLVGQTSGKIYRVCIDSIITKSPNHFVTDSIYYDETTANFFSINGRTYRKTVAGPAYGTKIHYTNSTSPLFVAKDPEYVKYTTSYGGSFTQRATCEFGNAIWYISGGSYGYTGNYTGEPYFEPSDPTSGDWSQWGFEFLDKIYKSAKKDGYHGLFWFSQGENVKIFDVDSGDELIEYTLSDRKDEIET